MNETIHIEVTPAQKALLLDGLSYLRSCALLDMRFPTDEVTQDRNHQVREIETLAEQLGGSHQSKTAASV
jgi:hypothetical protein